MRFLPSRRGLILGAAAAALGGCDRIAGSDWGRRTLKLGEDANLFVQRLLLKAAPLAPEYAEADISPWFKPNGTANPPDRAYKALARRKFADFRLEVGGLVEKPLTLSLADLRKLPARTQITRHDCVEGWSCIGKWTGIPLSELLDRAGLKPEARYIVFRCADTMEGGAAEAEDDSGSGQAGDNAEATKQAGGAPPSASGPIRYYESIDLVDAFHPQTILAYDMNGEALPIAHGAPLRLRLERQLGYKMAKYVMRIEVVADYADIGEGKGGYWEDQGYAWYAGI